MSETYHAMTLVAPRTLEDQIRNVSPPGGQDVWIRVSLAGICGTDLALYRGDYPTPLPLVLGHEFCGVVEQVGEQISENWLGRRVTAEINTTCLSQRRPVLCPECASGRLTHCRERTVIGISRQDGTFAGRLRCSAENLHPLPETMDDEVAVFVEPAAAALQTFDRRPLTNGERVVVFGAGRLGLLILAAARTTGGRVLAIARSPQSREDALLFGAQEALPPSENLKEQVREYFQGELADVVVDASGDPNAVTAALELVRPQGTLCLKTTAGLR